MIERLQRALEHVEELSPEAQEDLAQEIEDLTGSLGDLAHVPSDRGDLPGSGGDALPPSVRNALALAGAWSDLQGDDEFAALDRLRHERPPSPPMSEQLAWLDDDDQG